MIPYKNSSKNFSNFRIKLSLDRLITSPSTMNSTQITFHQRGELYYLNDFPMTRKDVETWLSFMGVETIPCSNLAFWCFVKQVLDEDFTCNEIIYSLIWFNDLSVEAKKMYADSINRPLFSKNLKIY